MAPTVSRQEPTGEGHPRQTAPHTGRCRGRVPESRAWQSSREGNVHGRDRRQKPRELQGRIHKRSTPAGSRFRAHAPAGVWPPSLGCAPGRASRTAQAELHLAVGGWSQSAAGSGCSCSQGSCRAWMCTPRQCGRPTPGHDALCPSVSRLRDTPLIARLRRAGRPGAPLPRCPCVQAASRWPWHEPLFHDDLHGSASRGQALPSLNHGPSRTAGRSVCVAAAAAAPRRK